MEWGLAEVKLNVD